MDIAQHDLRSAPPTDSSSPPSQSLPSPGSFSNTQLAALLADAYRDNENMRKELTSLRKRAEKAEKIIQVINSDLIASNATAGSATNGGAGNSTPLDSQQLQQQHFEKVQRLVDDYEEQVRCAQSARDEAETRRQVLFDGWEHVERYLVDLEFRAKDARSALSRIASSGGAANTLSLPGLPSPITLLSASASSPSSANPTQYPLATMGPPGAVPSHRTSRQSSSRTGIFPILPPHPNPNQPGTSHPPSTRRPRTPSLDAYAANQPPTKRSRTNADDQRGRESRTSYSESVRLLLFSLFFGLTAYVYLYIFPEFLSFSVSIIGLVEGSALTHVLLAVLAVISTLECMIFQINFDNADNLLHKNLQMRVSLIDTMDPIRLTPVRDIPSTLATALTHVQVAIPATVLWM